MIINSRIYWQKYEENVTILYLKKNSSNEPSAGRNDENNRSFHNKLIFL